MQPTNTPVQVGDVLAGKYRVERWIAAGGMGAVVAARHVELGELRAIKLMLAELCREPSVVRRFMQEARATVRLRSEHAVKIHDVGRLPRGEPYMVMEYLDGEDLRTVLDRRGRLPVERAVDYVLQALEAVAEAHAAGIVHRDLKPANLFLTRSADGLPCIKVLDFGISKLTGTLDVTPDLEVTTSGVFWGSPQYMSPEQMRTARRVDTRADIWSVGVVLYRMLTGKLPFAGKSLADICTQVITAKPRPPAAVRAEIPDGLDAVLLRCLEKDPEARVQTVVELAAALVPFGDEGSPQSVARIGRVVRKAQQEAVTTPQRRRSAAPEPTEPVAEDAPSSSGPPPLVEDAPSSSVPPPPVGEDAPSSAEGDSAAALSSWRDDGEPEANPRSLRLGMLLGAMGLLAIAVVGIMTVAMRTAEPDKLSPSSSATATAAASRSSIQQEPAYPPALTASRIESSASVQPSAAPEQIAPEPSKARVPRRRTAPSTSKVAATAEASATGSPDRERPPTEPEPEPAPTTEPEPAPTTEPDAPPSDPFGTSRQ